MVKQFFKVIIRVILLPVAFILHLIPHILGMAITLYRWVKYGGEFIVYTQEDKATMYKIFKSIREAEENPPN